MPAGSVGHREPAGFWRRAIAFAVDVALLATLLQGLGMVLFSATDGRIQLVDGLSFGIGDDCSPLSVIPEGVDIPADFHPNIQEDCTESLFGAPFARNASFEEKTARKKENTAGAVTVTMQKWRSFSVPLDAQGRAVKPLDLGWLFIPLFAAYRIIGESRSGKTLGRWILGIQLVDANGSAASALQLFRRYIAFLAPAVPLAVLTNRWFPGAKLAGLACIVAFALWAAIAIVRRHPPFYDKFANTRVIRAR